MVIPQPQLRMDMSGLRHNQGKIYLGVALNSWQNKYEIEGLQDNVWLVLSVWKL